MHKGTKGFIRWLKIIGTLWFVVLLIFAAVVVCSLFVFNISSILVFHIPIEAERKSVKQHAPKSETPQNLTPATTPIMGRRSPRRSVTPATEDVCNLSFLEPLKDSYTFNDTDTYAKMESKFEGKPAPKSSWYVTEGEKF